MTSSVLEREAVLPARAGWDLRRGLRQLALAGAVPLVTLTAAWYGHHWWTVGRFIETTDDAYVGGDITVIAPKVAGFIGEVAVADNQAVHAGDLLVKLDDRDYRAALDRAIAAVAAQRAGLANLDATRQLQEAMVAQANAEIAAADAEVARAEFDLVRYRRLASNEFASTQRLQRADADHKQAVAAADKARAARPRPSASSRSSTPASSRCRRRSPRRRPAARSPTSTSAIPRSARRSTACRRSQRARRRVSRPIGAYLMSLVPAQGLWVDANFKERPAGAMRPGQPASVVADVLPGQGVLGPCRRAWRRGPGRCSA